VHSIGLWSSCHLSQRVSSGVVGGEGLSRENYSEIIGKHLIRHAAGGENNVRVVGPLLTRDCDAGAITGW